MFVQKKGCLFLIVQHNVILPYLKTIPKQWQEQQQKRDSNDYHITILTPNENKIKKLGEPTSTNFEICGLKVYSDVAFLVVHFPAGDSFRKELKLIDKTFHITLGFADNDNHEVNKSLQCLSKQDINLNFFKINTYPEKQLKIMEYLISIFPNDVQVLKYYFDAQMKVEQYYEAFATSQILCEKDLEAGTTSMLHANKHVQMMTNEMAVNIAENLCEKPASNVDIGNGISNHQFICDRLNRLMVKKSICVQTGVYSIMKKPKNFSQITSHLFGSAIIKSDHISFLRGIGITTIINLMESHEEPLNDALMSAFNGHYYNFQIKDRSITTMDHTNLILNKITECIANDERVVVHCLGGKGRTNLILACYLMREKNVHYGEIMEKFNKTRDVLVSDEQITFMRNFVSKKSQMNIIFNNKKCPNMIVMIGLPCSGKSTLSSHILENVSDTMCVTQDGNSRDQIIPQIRKGLQTSKLVIVDKCNFASKDRKEVLAQLVPTQKAWAIVFNISEDECLYRAKKRENHATVGLQGAARAITEMANKFELVGPKEGFDEVIVIQSSDDLNFILKSWNIPEIISEQEHGFMKFPRTEHLAVLGNVSRDDLSLPKDQIAHFLNQEITIEEKIDGANLGISIDPESFRIMYQNRSHYVTHESATQFEKLVEWEKKNREDLFNVLGSEEIIGKYILFGEWLYAKHSIHYTQLPAYFIAFDIFDKGTQRFLSREKLEQILAPTSIPIIRLIAKGTYKKVEEIIALVNTQSAYHAGHVEGVYVRLCVGNHTIKRSKIVSQQFLNGINEHWKGKDLVENKLIIM